jgi:alkylhydroperoxidase/carboxymuconolactone decarboxylase family protein YurZ
MARRAGWSEEELSEALLHMAGYVGLPAVREGLIVAKGVFARCARNRMAASAPDLAGRGAPS